MEREKCMRRLKNGKKVNWEGILRGQDRTKSEKKLTLPCVGYLVTSTFNVPEKKRKSSLLCDKKRISEMSKQKTTLFMYIIKESFYATSFFIIIHV